MRNPKSETRNPNLSPRGPIRVAVLSLLFNWPSTGGGNLHTAGLVEFLSRAGYDVRHFYARYLAWGIGRVTEDAYVRRDLETSGQGDGGVGDPRRTAACEAIEFTDGGWNAATIRGRFHSAVDLFAPDYVVISDTWNMKPHLPEAMRGYPYLLLVQAQECLCPLNNLRISAVELSFATLLIKRRSDPAANFPIHFDDDPAQSRTFLQHRVAGPFPWTSVISVV